MSVTWWPPVFRQIMFHKVHHLSLPEWINISTHQLTLAKEI